MRPTSPECEPGTPADEAAAEAVVGRLMEHRHRLYAFISKQLVNPADVEDVLQRTSMVIWRKADRFDPRRSFFHWACGIAFNEVRNFLRVRGRNRLHFDPELVETLATEAEDEDDLSRARLDALRTCMARLEKRQRRVLEACYSGASSMTDIAQGLGRSRDALYKQVGRLRTGLLDCIRRRLRREGIRG